MTNFITPDQVDGAINSTDIPADFCGESDKNLYQILNVNPDATRLELRESFLRLKSTYSSGNAALYSLIGEGEANEAFAEAEEAFRTLTDAVSRQAYDQKMRFSKNQESQISDAALSEANYGLDAAGYDSTAAASERLNFMRSQNTANYVDPASALTREAQPIVKVKADNAGKEKIAEKFTELMESSDLSDGDLFRQLREAAGVSLDELQDRTKVSVAYITDIEANRFDRLPQLVYVKGFLRCIFKYLGVGDSDKLVKAYALRLEEWLKAKNNI